MAYLGGPSFRRRQQLRLAKPPPGGFAPPPRRLRAKDPSRSARQERKLAQQRDVRDLRIFVRVATVIGVLAAIATVVLIIIAAAVYH